MDRLKQRYDLLLKALESLQIVLKMKCHVITTY